MSANPIAVLLKLALVVQGTNNLQNYLLVHPVRSGIVAVFLVI